MYYIGIDLGTSSLKGLLADANGKIIKEASASYPVYSPKEGWSEQNPEDWLIAFKRVLGELKAGITCEIGGISFGGQMHGLVALDKDDNVIRPAILWNDGRTQKETDYLNEVVGKEKLSALTANIAFAGFTAPKILWLKNNEPQNFARINKIMLPKDYLAYMLTGVHSCDYSDASGMLLLDVKNKRWSDEMCEICSVKKEWLPALYESYGVTGKPKAEYGLENCVVTAGAGDNAAAAIGTGAVANGDCNISLGTSGTVFISTDNFCADEHNALHSFCHASGKWHVMGCILSAASARKWWLEDILNTTDYAADETEAEKQESGGVIFLPYLSGERSPHNDVKARGVFFGLSSVTTRGQMSRAIMEGVAFALRDSMEICAKNGVFVKKTTICGGGAKSKLWRKIIADMMGIPVEIPLTEQGPSYGAAILAMVGAGEYGAVEEAVRNIVSVKETILPDMAKKAYYDKKYNKFKKLYPLLKDVFKEE